MCGDSRPVKPTNVEVMPALGCGKAVIMKNTGKDNIKRLLYIIHWRLAVGKSRVAEAVEAAGRL